MDTVSSRRRTARAPRAPNGLVVLTEALPGVRSAAVGIWVRTASAHERREQMGISHLLEHMVFKGTERRTAQELALELEVRGGIARRLHRPRPHQLPGPRARRRPPARGRVLTDLVRRPLLRESDLELERNVILEEINGVEDTPDDLVFELHAADALARPSLRLLDPRHARDAWAGSRADDLRCAPPDGLLPRQLRHRRRGQHRPRPAARRCSSAEGWFEGAAPSRPRRRSRPARGPRGATGVEDARHGADPHRVRHRHLSAPRPAPLRRSPS